MSNIVSTALTLLVFTILVVIHEFGHFAMAKKSGVLVEEFAVGIGPILLKKQKGETLYTIRAFPVGGFCRMLGEDEVYDNRGFNAKSPLSRILILLAGPFLNFVFSFVIVFFLAATSAATAFPVINGFVDGTNAQSAGFEIGDEIVTIENQSIGTYQEMFFVMSNCGGKELAVTVKRDGVKKEIFVIPVFTDNNRWIIGITPQIKTGVLAEDVAGYEKATLFDTTKDSIFLMRYYVKSVVVGFVRIFTLNISPEEVSGPIGVVKIIDDNVSSNIQYGFRYAFSNLLVFMALISVNLSVLNLFPLPALDGGRVVLVLIEVIRGKAMDSEKEGRLNYLGFLFLIAFAILVASNDILQLIKG